MSPTRSPRQPSFGAFFGELFEEGDEIRMAPVAVARQPHHLPGLAVDRHRDGAGEAALGVEADRARLQRRRRGAAAEQFLGGRLRIVGIGERRQRLRIDACLCPARSRRMSRRLQSPTPDRTTRHNESRAGVRRGIRRCHGRSFGPSPSRRRHPNQRSSAAGISLRPGAAASPFPALPQLKLWRSGCFKTMTHKRWGFAPAGPGRTTGRRFAARLR